MFCTKCGKEVSEEMEKCPNCGSVLATAKKETTETAKEKKSLGSKIKMVGNIVGGIILVIFLLYVAKGLLEGRSLTDIMYNPEQGSVDPKEDSGYTYYDLNGNVIDTDNNDNSTDIAENNNQNDKSAVVTPDASDMIMMAEDWEGYYRRDDGMVIALFKNDDHSLLITIGDETGTWMYVQDEVAQLSENGAEVNYTDSDYNIVISYASGEDVCIVTQYDNSEDDFSGSYYYTTEFN